MEKLHELNIKISDLQEKLLKNLYELEQLKFELEQHKLKLWVEIDEEENEKGGKKYSNETKRQIELRHRLDNDTSIQLKEDRIADLELAIDRDKIELGYKKRLFKIELLVVGGVE